MYDIFPLTFISEEDLIEHTRKTIQTYGTKLEPFNVEKFNSNIIDPIKLIFDKMVYQSTWEEILYKYYHDNQTSPYGWIDREGNFFGCDYMEHRDCANACFNLTETQAEKQGYIKIYSALGELEYYCNGRMTVAQKNTLENRGFTVDECEVNWNE